MTDHDVNPIAAGYMPPSTEITRDPRLNRSAQDDLHMAIDLAYNFAASIKNFILWLKSKSKE